MTKTTDNQSEIFDVVDGSDKVIGQATRGEVHGNPKLTHRSIGVVIFNSQGEIFLQQRSETKDVDPGKWTISCSGHLMSDPSTIGGVMASLRSACHPRGVLRLLYEVAAHRELKEELGVDLEIIPVTKFIYRSDTETEIVGLFKAYSDGPFKLKRDEIIQGKFFTRKKLNSLMKSGQIDICKWGKMALLKIEWL